MNWKKDRDEAARKHAVNWTKPQLSDEGIAALEHAWNLGADWEHKRCEDVLGRVKECILEIVTPCTHDENDPNYRGMGDGYGWCSRCGAKVDYKENYGLEALTLLEGIGGEE